jgi:hypothetical protein
VAADQQTGRDQADSAEVSAPETSLDSIAIALEHVTKWREFYTTSGLQVLYFFLVAAALLSTAYVSALNGRLHVVAGVIALGGVALSGTAYLVGRRQRDVARLADPPMAELESRLACIARVDSLRMSQQAEESRRQWWRNATVMANVMFPMAAVVSVAAALYAWIGR